MSNLKICFRVKSGPYSHVGQWLLRRCSKGLLPRVVCYRSRIDTTGQWIRSHTALRGVKMIKENAFQGLVNHHALMEGRLHEFLALALDGGGQLHLPAALTSE